MFTSTWSSRTSIQPCSLWWIITKQFTNRRKLLRKCRMNSRTSYSLVLGGTIASFSISWMNSSELTSLWTQWSCSTAKRAKNMVSRGMRSPNNQFCSLLMMQRIRNCQSITRTQNFLRTILGPSTCIMLRHSRKKLSIPIKSMSSSSLPLGASTARISLPNTRNWRRKWPKQILISSLQKSMPPPTRSQKSPFRPTQPFTSSKETNMMQ